LESDQEGAADDELRAVMEFDEPDDAQAEADVKSIASKHKTTLQELKEQILGSVSYVYQRKEKTRKISFILTK
jgi:hypothetical protein